MEISEVIIVGHSLTMVQKKCDEYLIDDIHLKETNRVDLEAFDPGLEIDENPLSDEEEENVISSLFPSSNQKDILLLCESILIGILDRLKGNSCTLSSNNMRDIIYMLEESNMTEAFIDDIRLEVERRTSLLKSRLHHEMKEDDNNDDESNQSTQKFKIRNLFSKQITKENGVRKTIDSSDNEVRDILRLFQLTKDSDELHYSMLQDIQRTASELGQCKRSLTNAVGNQALFQQRNRKSLLYPR